MSSQISHDIKGRTKPQDVFYTPKELALLHIDMIDKKWNKDTWCDPCYGEGVYFDNFPKDGLQNMGYELTKGDDFLTRHREDILEDVDDNLIIISNPPYSILDLWLAKTVELKPVVFSYLLLQHHITPKRLERLEKAGYRMTKMKYLKVFKWYGISVIVEFELMDEFGGLNNGDDKVDMTYNRTVFR